MNIKLALVVALSFAPLTFGFAHANCVTDDPTELAKAFYAKHVDFHFENPAKIESIVTPRLLSALTREYKCAKGNICAIEAVPWTDAQDGDVGKPIAFQTTENSEVQASVKMSYTFVLSKTQKRQQSVLLKFQRSSTNECWLLSDMISPRGVSLVTHIEKWHKKFGDVR